MGLLSSVLRSGSIENPANPVSWASAFGAGEETYTGEAVSITAAMNYSAVRACQRVLAESVASLPCILYERLARGKQRADKTSLYRVLHDQANPEMTAFTFFEVAMVHLTGWGNFYAEIVRTGDGDVAELWPLNPEKTQLRRDSTGKRFFELTLPQGGVRRLTAAKVLHVIGVSMDGVHGISMLSAHRNAIAIGLALEKFTGKFFANDAMPGGVLEHPGTLKDDAHKRLRSSWEGLHRGLENRHRIAILEEGMKLHEMGINIEDSQLLPLKRFQLEEVSRIYRVPLHLINDLERATYNNIDILDIGFVKHSLRPWLVRFEQSIRLQLMTPVERERYFAEFLVDAMERGDPEKRSKLYTDMRLNGLANGNELRAKENLNPVDGLDSYWMPANYVVVGEPAEQPVDRSAARPVEKRSSVPRLSASFRSSLRDVVSRILRAEEREISKALKKAAGEDYRQQLQAFIEGYYSENIDFVLRQLRLVLEPFGAVAADDAAEQVNQKAPASAERFVTRYTEAAAERYVGYSRHALLKIVSDAETDEDIEPAILERLDAWKQTRGESVAKEETVRLAGAVATFVFGALGVQYLRWQASGEDCPACAALDGKIVGIDEPFVPEGQELDMGEGQARMKLGRSIGHPPLHGGCDCTVGPG